MHDHWLHAKRGSYDLLRESWVKLELDLSNFTTEPIGIYFHYIYYFNIFLFKVVSWENGDISRFLFFRRDFLIGASSKAINNHELLEDVAKIAMTN